jgi:hypothetical protein
MSENILKVTVDLSPDEGLATVRIGNGAPSVCKALGVDRDAHGKPKTIYLDRFIHRSVRSRGFEGWQPAGAITTILHKL